MYMCTYPGLLVEGMAADPVQIIRKHKSLIDEFLASVVYTGHGVSVCSLESVQHVS